MMLLEATGVSKAFGGLQALKGVDLQVRRGEIVGVIGPNGAGKTTLFGCLSGFHRSDAGQVTLCGERIDRSQPHDICRLGMARTFQLVRPFQGMTVLENVMVAAMVRHPATAVARDKAAHVLERTGIVHLAGRDASGLSLADLRAMEVARALATEPQLLLLDEMLAGLTPVEAEQMHERFLSLRDDGLGLLVIEHSVPTVTRLCDQVVVLDFGQVIASGTSAHVLANARVQEAYLGKRPARSGVKAADEAGAAPGAVTGALT
ncbi:MAG: ABC transporter ATP-binding protein [Comamonadaceae bacterium]|nr:MAG: ABC transporter ATP-binding protein [Comamonadaceae bacterium]